MYIFCLLPYLHNGNCDEIRSPGVGSFVNVKTLNKHWLSFVPRKPSSREVKSMESEVR